MAELISAKDLPTTESAVVQLLCVDEGELKLKNSNAMVGGTGYVIKIPTDAPIVQDEKGIMIRLEENYDTMAQLISGAASLWIDFSATAVAAGFGAEWMMVPVGYAAYADGSFFFGINYGTSTVTIVCPNGSWTPATE